MRWMPNIIESDDTGEEMGIGSFALKYVFTCKCTLQHIFNWDFILNLNLFSADVFFSVCGHDLATLNGYFIFSICVYCDFDTLNGVRAHTARP